MQNPVGYGEARDQDHGSREDEPDPPVNLFRIFYCLDLQRYVSDNKLRLNQVRRVFIDFEFRVDRLEPIIYCNSFLQGGLNDVFIKEGQV
jgi:hypothetical protein